MLLLLSPAKNLDFDSAYSVPETSTPLMLEESEKLMAILKKKSARSLAKLMNISPDLAELNYDRNQEWTAKHQVSNTTRPALLTFNGAVYWGIDAKGFTKKELQFAQKHIAILSGLYGVLRPLDVMQAYRLEMGTKLPVSRKKNLYEFWGDKISEQLNQLAGKEPTFINLASNEYFKAVKPKVLNGKVINFQFKEYRDGKYKAIMTYAKTARGLMTNYIVKNSITKAADIKGFNLENYSFNAPLSTETDWVFTRG